MNEADVLDALRKRFGPPEFAFITHVRNGTGYTNVTRTADALAMGLWPSRGLVLHGFEVKVSKADWRRELKAPEKADVIAKRCHYWWIVAPKDVVPAHELPDAWGLVEIGGRGTHVVKQSPRRDPVEPSWEFVAAILRRAQESITPEAAIEKARKEAYAEGLKSGQERISYELERLRHLQENVKVFEQASGVKIENGWDHGKIGEAVALVRDGRRPFERMRELAQDVLRATDEVLASNGASNRQPATDG